MRYVLFLLLLIYPILSPSQVVWQEDFSTYTNGTQNAIKWTTSANNCDADGAPAALSGNYWGVYNGEFRCNDIEGLTCCSSGSGGQGNSDNTWTSQNINVSAYSNVSISILLRVVGDAMECASCGLGGDYLNALYSTNGGTSWTSFATICGADVGYTVTECVSVIGANNLIIRVVLGNQANTENYYFDNVVVSVGNCPILAIDDFELSVETVDNNNYLKWIPLGESYTYSILYSTDTINWVLLGKTLESRYNLNNFSSSYFKVDAISTDGTLLPSNIINYVFDGTSKLVKRINIMGVEVFENVGLVIFLYEDGSYKKIYYYNDN